MDNELADRQQAVKLRLAGQSVEAICHLLGRSHDWFHTWWRRYRADGPNGLFDRTRANGQPRRIAPDLERTILTIRQRLTSQVHPGTRYSLIGASTIVAELEALQIRPLPSARTIERVLERHGVTLPKVRLAPWVAPTTYPTPQAEESNQLHQVDCVGPIYLKGQRQRYYIFVGKDVFDGAVCLRLYRSRRMETVLDFLGECWKSLGLPAQVQFDNAREVVGWGSAARYLSRVLRLCLRFKIEPVIIPPAHPERNGSVEHFNGWFQPRLLKRHYARVSALKRELQRLQETVNDQHVQRRLGGLTPRRH
jgi:putative transposase